MVVVARQQVDDYSVLLDQEDGIEEQNTNSMGQYVDSLLNNTANITTHDLHALVDDYIIKTSSF